jgi:FlaA1/EpsC-like NDP-sugar epimerase
MPAKQISNFLVRISRSTKQAMMLVADILMLLFAVWAAYALRLGEWFLPNMRQTALMLVAPLIALPIFIRTGLYRSVIRYVEEQALWAIIQSMIVASLIWAALAFIVQATGLEGVPRSIPLLYCLVGITLIGSSRFVARWLLWLPLQKRYAGRQVLIYGAGNAGRELAASLRQGRQFFPAGFLDDEMTLQGKDVAGLRVYRPQQLGALIDRFDIHDVIVTMPSAPHTRRKQVVAFLEQYPVRVRILPAMSDIASGRHLINSLREVDIGDLLGRDSVTADPDLLGLCIAGKSVLVTGAGGSIGSELCRQIGALSPDRLVLLEANEFALYQIDRVLAKKLSCKIIPCLGSIKDRNLVNRLIQEHKIQTIYHAAAHKHVPLVETNMFEGVLNNVFGTQAVAEAALAQGVETFVLISTDKAVRPTNTMGATKRWAELIVQDYARKARESKTGQRFCAVRFGNVLGSSGSVIPLFKEQIEQGGPVTVTHAEVTRYFMSIHEAVELVIQAGSMAQGGEVFLLDMGEPVKIMDLARNMIRLAGHTVQDDENPDGEIGIVVTGLRPGEKLYEELLIHNSNAEGTSHPKIMKADEPMQRQLSKLLERLRQQIEAYNHSEVRRMLMDIALMHTDNATLDEVEKAASNVLMAANVIPLSKG